MRSWFWKPVLVMRGTLIILVLCWASGVVMTECTIHWQRKINAKWTEDYNTLDRRIQLTRSYCEGKSAEITAITDRCTLDADSANKSCGRTERTLKALQKGQR